MQGFFNVCLIRFSYSAFAVIFGLTTKITSKNPIADTIAANQNTAFTPFWILDTFVGSDAAFRSYATPNTAAAIVF